MIFFEKKAAEFPVDGRYPLSVSDCRPDEKGDFSARKIDFYAEYGYITARSKHQGEP